jgi:dienelactone hydrolase
MRRLGESMRSIHETSYARYSRHPGWTVITTRDLFVVMCWLERPPKHALRQAAVFPAGLGGLLRITRSPAIPLKFAAKGNLESLRKGGSMLIGRASISGLLAVLLAGCAASGPSGNEEQLVTREHYVNVPSKVPGVPQAITRIYVREKASPAPVAGGPAAGEGVVLFVHGAGTPADVAFDVPREGYSWMAHLAKAGFNVFSMDHTGYGRSTRPAGMDDPCNLPPKEQGAFVRSGTTCKPFQPGYLSDLAAEWDEIDAVVEYLRRLKKVNRVHLVAWSRGGPRAAGFAARHPDKVHRMVLLAPAYLRTTPAAAPDKPPASAAQFNTQSR